MVLIAANGRGLAMGWNSERQAETKVKLNNQKYNKMKNADKSLSAGTEVDNDSTAQNKQVSQPNGQGFMQAGFNELFAQTSAKLKN